MMVDQYISEYSDVIDSREIIDRIDELDLMAEDGELSADEAEELAELRALAQECEGYASDWHYGEALINDSHFVDYAREMAEDCGMINSDAAWPMRHIDWDAAADELKGDYMSIEFRGVTFWIRCS